MPLHFSDTCLLLQRLEDIELRDPPFIDAKEKAAQIRAVIQTWFKSHRRSINSLDIKGAVALISTFLPERRTDRVYGIQCARLCRILGRCLSLSAARTRDLGAYEQPERGDLGICVERVLQAGGPPAHPVVDLDEVDAMLQILAGLSPFSGPEVARLPPGSSETRDKLLGNIFKRLQPQEAKWVIRLILKDFSPVRVNEREVLRSFHFLLPDLLHFQNDFTAAIGLLKGPLREYPESPDPRSERLHRHSARALLRPIVGVKVGRPHFTKARSIEHSMRMLGSHRWVLERKYDGEYCEIHIDLSKSSKLEDCITIFSKSGKDSTKDRIGIHKTLMDCLGLGRPDCKIKRKAIILGELVVYSDEQRQVLPFDQIRKHVSRSDRCIGTDNDSQIRPGEHLAIVFFDILLLDDEVTMNEPVDKRREKLRGIYKKTGGRAWSAEWKVVDFSEPQSARKRLTEQFAASIAERCEGLILKPCEVPYFPFGATLDGRDPSYIKLKKDYIQDLGDEADFAVIGGSYNAQEAAKCGIAGVQWTEFYLGCLMNKFDVLRFDARPRFKIVGTISQKQCIPKPILQAANAIGKFVAKPYVREQAPLSFDLDHDTSLKIQSVFDNPLVFEVLGSGFEKPSNCNFLMLRHPRVKKLHEDRSWKDCVSMEELQTQAYAARGTDANSESQETRDWIEKLERKLRRKSDRRRSATPRSATMSTTANAASTVKSAATSSTKVSTGERNLDGTTLISSAVSPKKRNRDDEAETPCPVPKRVCIKPTNPTPIQPHISKTAPVRPSPLSEITNSSARFSSTKPLSSDTSYDNPAKPAKTPSILQHQAAHTTICTSADCPLNNAVFYLAPSLTLHPHFHALLDQSCFPTVSSLSHWDRDSHAYPPLTATVSESQAYPGLKKVILIDRRSADWRQEFMAVLTAVKGLDKGKFRERIDFWDVNVLLEKRHKECEAWWARSAFFLGFSRFQREEGRVRFVPRRKGMEMVNSDAVDESATMLGHSELAQAIAA